MHFVFPAGQMQKYLRAVCAKAADVQLLVQSLAEFRRYLSVSQHVGKQSDSPAEQVEGSGAALFCL
jgi:hypothetical protein